MPKYKITRIQTQIDTVEIEIPKEEFDEYLADPFIGSGTYHRPYLLDEYVLNHIESLGEWEWSSEEGSSEEFKVDEIHRQE